MMQTTEYQPNIDYYARVSRVALAVRNNAAVKHIHTKPFADGTYHRWVVSRVAESFDEIHVNRLIYNHCTLNVFDEVDQWAIDASRRHVCVC